MSHVHLELSMMLASINFRREKAGEDEADIGCDLKFSGEVGIDKIAPIFQTASAKRALLALYREDATLAGDDIESVALSRQLQDLVLVIAPEGEETMRFEGVKANHFALTPRHGEQVEMTFRLQLNPTEAQAGPLTELLRNRAFLIIDTVQGELPLQEAPPKKASAPDATSEPDDESEQQDEPDEEDEGASLDDIEPTHIDAPDADAGDEDEQQQPA